MFYYLYQITNLVNNKIYVGVHKTNDLNDGYMGSGKVIKSAIEKYGIGNFKKDILEYFDSSEAMYAREKEIVTDEFLLREDTYNLRRGGHGGFDYINTNRSTEEWSNLGKLARKYSPGNTNAPRTEEWNRKVSQSNMGKQKFLGKTHSEETKRKIGASNSLRQSGEKNSQYGTMWITNGIESKRIDKNCLIPDGWHKGRKQKRKFKNI
jgi:group I intron endonuclease